jgi:pimeloyl-ACP methyl ester carboxylesterase
MPSATATPETTFVLVHGAFHGGWCWRQVGDRLSAAGTRVFAPTMTGLGERAHLLTRDVGIATFFDDVCGLIVAEELSDIVLVGHSFGGAVISGVADRMPGRIRLLVYLDAVVPESGRSAISLLPAETQAVRIRTAQESSGGLSIPVPQGNVFDLPLGPDRDWVARRITPHPLAAYTDPIHLNGPVGNGRPRAYIRCTDPVYPAVVPSYDTVKNQPGWTLIDLATGHDAMVSAPGPLADLLLTLATPQT